MAELIIPSREASVEVMVLESCPDHFRERLEFARDEIYKAFPNSRLRKKLNNKTIGVMMAGCGGVWGGRRMSGEGRESGEEG